ncbi:MAG: hypothetical protein JWR35_3795 [Marmoricola sp.]|nr:hypothetical protein [Marmoricola sp.]
MVLVLAEPIDGHVYLYRRAHEAVVPVAQESALEHSPEDGSDSTPADDDNDQDYANVNYDNSNSDSDKNSDSQCNSDSNSSDSHKAVDAANSSTGSIDELFMHVNPANVKEPSSTNTIKISD